MTGSERERAETKTLESQVDCHTVTPGPANKVDILSSQRLVWYCIVFYQQHDSGSGTCEWALVLVLRVPDPCTCVLLHTPQEAERKADELRARRKEHVRAVLMSQNFLEGVPNTCSCTHGPSI